MRKKKFSFAEWKQIENFGYPAKVGMPVSAILGLLIADAKEMAGMEMCLQAAEQDRLYEILCRQEPKSKA